jgi:hypothetical protein
MTYLLYFDLLQPHQRRSVLLAFTLFALFEATLLVLFHPTPVAAVVSAVSLLVLVLLFRKDSLRRLLDLPCVDLLLFAVVIILTIRPYVATWPRDLPRGYLSSRMDFELLVVITVTLLTAIAFPSVNDLFHLDKIRPVQYLTSIPFGPRRGITSGVALLALFGITAVFLSGSEGLLASAVILGLCGFCVPWLFQYVYGYRSYIMVLFGLSLADIAVLSLLVQLPFVSQSYPKVVTALLLGGGGGWVVGWAGAVQQIWRNTNPDFLVSGQNIAHTLYILTLGFGHLIIYALWIGPIALPSDCTHLIP